MFYGSLFAGKLFRGGLFKGGLLGPGGAPVIPDDWLPLASIVNGGAPSYGLSQYGLRILDGGAPDTDYTGLYVVDFGKESAPADIGVAGAEGFGVGVYTEVLPAGLSAMGGTTDPSHENYGNYQYTDGSICCFIPAFYYRIGSASSPRYATYGANAFDIAKISDFADEAAANAAGYVFHRAFIDGGQKKLGFFIDKYLSSQDTATGSTHGSSLKNGVPISLTTTTGYTRSNGMTGCTGIVADAITLSRARGAGFWNAASAFQYAALAILATAHGQAATAATHCAWYDATLTTNFPKGCNNDALGSADDGAITYTTAGDAGDAAKPLTGSANLPAKVAHNGQLSGVMDLNGSMWEVATGVTTYGSSATDATQRASGDPDVGDFWTLKPSVALADLTAGWDGATDHWQSAANIEMLYDLVEDGMWWAWNANGWDRYGNGTEAVLSGAASGDGYLRTSVGHPLAATGVSAGGSNLFGVDGLYQYQRRNLAIIAGGDWGLGSDSGLWARGWGNRRKLSNIAAGCRSSGYGV